CASGSCVATLLTPCPLPESGKGGTLESYPAQDPPSHAGKGGRGVRSVATPGCKKVTRIPAFVKPGRKLYYYVMPEERLTRYNERLAASGVRLTPQRFMVLEALAASPGHTTA